MNLAVVGGGYWGRNLIREFYALNVLKIICDIDDSTFEFYREKYPEVIVTKDWAMVLQDSNINSVCISIPEIYHYEYAKSAILAGKDVFLEKPMCLTVAEAEDLHRIVTASDRILMVGLVFNYHPAFVKMRHLVKTGLIGKIQHVMSNRTAFGVYKPETGLIWDLGVHDVSFISSLLDDYKPDVVSCQKAGHLVNHNNQDSIRMTMYYEKLDVYAEIYVSRLHPVPDKRIIIIGTDGIFVFDLNDKQLLLFESRQNINKAISTRTLFDNVEPQNIPYDTTSALECECRTFIECCRTRTQPITDSMESLRVIKILTQFENSGTKYSVNMNDVYINPTAMVQSGAKIGSGTKIWHWCHIMQAIIGKDCNIGQCCFIESGVQLGNRVRVKNNISLYDGVVCEDDVFLGPSCVFTNDLFPRNRSICPPKAIRQTYIETGASIGANATIVCGNRLGKYCLIGAGSVVIHDVKPYALMVGNPARQIGWVSKFGTKLKLPLKTELGESITLYDNETGETYLLENNVLTTID